MPDYLDWPLEATRPSEPGQRWSQPQSNICLDFHGDPVTAGLVVFSDGNHHMALEASLQTFRQQYPEVNDIFYATTPPSVIVNLLTQGQIVLGNLTLSRLPHVFVSPPGIMEKLKQGGHVVSHQCFMRSRCNVLLVRKGNPKNIQGIADLLRDDVRMFISNPVTEKASYDVYAETLLGLADEQGLATDDVRDLLSGNSGRLVTGSRIHHRETPQCLYEEQADVAIIYYHLALRYTRIFPNIFELIPLQGTVENPEPSAKNIRTSYHIGLVGDGGKWGRQCIDFMFSDEVTRLYESHGLHRP
jgi:hypothetical protein